MKVFLPGAVLFLVIALPGGADTLRILPDGGYFTDWLVTGPLDGAASPEALLEAAGGANAAPREGDPAAGGIRKWTRYRGEGNVINLREVAGYAECLGAAAYCEFESDADQPGHIHYASQNALQVWLNGNLVFEKPAVPYEPLNWLDCGVELLQGVNSCLVICSDTASQELFGFALRVDSPEVTVLPPLVWNPIVPASGPGGGGWTAQASGSRFWSGIASSADGTKLAACVNTGYIYISTDSGGTWKASAFKQAWIDVVSSADGGTLVATWDMDLCVSTDSGVTWTPKFGAWNGWGKVACSADGMTIAACTTHDYSGGYLLLVSTDRGNTFTYCNPRKLPYSDVAVSADGTKIVACVAGGRIWTSADTGVTWMARESERNWRSVASSADGTKLAACVWGGQIYTSDDSGVTWTPCADARDWCVVASSADGMRLASHDYCGRVHLSADSGVTWIPCGPAQNFKGLAMSADGATLAAGAWANPVYTLKTADAFMARMVAGLQGPAPGSTGSAVDSQCKAHTASRMLTNEDGLSRESSLKAAHPDGGYLTDWLVVGPLGDEIPFDALTECARSAYAAPREGGALKGKGMRWMRYYGGGNIINLREIAGYDAFVTAAAYCEFYSDADQRGYFHCVSQNALQLWVNGVPVFDQPEVPRQPLKWIDRSIEIKRGFNSCLIVCSAYNSDLFGFAMRVNGQEVTPPPPLVWNPIIPGTSVVDDGRYVLLSPEWRWREGDDPAWSKPGFADSNWAAPPWPAVVQIAAGSTYWMRVRGHFAPGSTPVPYTFVATNAKDFEVYLDGVRVHGGSMLDSFLNLFQHRDTAVCLPSECVLAVRVVSEGFGRPLARIAVRRADKAMNEELRVGQPRKHHRLFLMFLLAASIVYYLLVYRNHPRQIEGTVCCVTVALAILAMLSVIADSWTFNQLLPTAAWMSSICAAIAYICGIAMVHVMAYGAVSWRAVLWYSAVSVVLFASGWKMDTRWIAFSIFPLMTLEYIRAWIMYDLIPRRANRGVVGIGLFFCVAGGIITAAYGVSNGQHFSAFGPYAHLYGLVGLVACLVMYTSRESALGMHELQGLTATLEDRVAERTRQVQELTQRLILAGEAERERLSRDLHDSVAQTLWYAKMAAENGSRTGTEHPEPGELVELLDKAIGEVRMIAYGLRPPELDKLGFVKAISQCCKDFSDKTGIFLDFEAHGADNVRLSSVIEVNLYRVLQEALNNIQQHARASKVRVRLAGSFPWVILRVEDNGRGFDIDRERDASDGHMGLRNMEERMRLLGGTMRVRSAPGAGTRLVFEVPQPKENPDVGEAQNIDRR